MVTIGRAARQAGMTIDSLRFYEKTGLLKPPPRSASGYRAYRDEDILRLRFIQRAKTLGFSLDEIGQLLRITDHRGKRADIHAIAGQRLEALREKIADLTRIERALAGLVEACDGAGGVSGCPIIESLLDDRRSTANCPSDLDAATISGSCVGKEPDYGRNENQA